MHTVKLIDLGLKDYKETWDYQKSVHEKLTEMKAGKANVEIQPHLIFVEHPHVYTLGKSGKKDNLLINPDFLRSLGASFYKTDRGGDITYHGPGQIVVSSGNRSSVFTRLSYSLLAAASVPVSPILPTNR